MMPEVKPDYGLPYHRAHYCSVQARGRTKDGAERPTKVACNKCDFGGHYPTYKHARAVADEHQIRTHATGDAMCGERGRKTTKSPRLPTHGCPGCRALLRKAQRCRAKSGDIGMTSPGDAALAELQRLADAATPGPWQYDQNPSRVVTSAADSTSVTACYNTGAEQDDANARFIAAARMAVPALLSEVARLTEERDFYQLANEEAQEVLSAARVQIAAVEAAVASPGLPTNWARDVLAALRTAGGAA